MKRTIFFALLFMLFNGSFAWGQIPKTLSYQGILKDASGKPLNQKVTLTLKIYDQETGGLPLWQEEIANVTTSEGVFNVILGKNKSLASLGFDKPYWLSVEVDGKGELRPRSELTASPYSLQSTYTTQFLKIDGKPVPSIFHKGKSALSDGTPTLPTDSSDLSITISTSVKCVIYIQALTQCRPNASWLRGDLYRNGTQVSSNMFISSSNHASVRTAIINAYSETLTPENGTITFTVGVDGERITTSSNGFGIMLANRFTVFAVPVP